MSFTVSAVVGGLYLLNDMKEQARIGSEEQQKAQSRAEQRAKKSELLQEQSINKQNQKKPDIFGMLRANQLAAAGSTSLTGSSGVDLNSLKLGKTTLLGL